MQAIDHVFLTVVAVIMLAWSTHNAPSMSFEPIETVSTQSLK